MDKTKKRRKFKKEFITQVMVLTLLFILTVGNVAYAAGTDNTWMSNLSNWIRSGVQYIALAFVAVMAVKHLFKRQFMQFASFLILTAFVLVIIMDPSKLTTIGSYIWKVIFG